jgi:acetoacetyl-CoA synthetase
MSTDPDKPLWTPDPRSAAASEVAGFARFVRSRLGVTVSDTDYSALHAWSVREIEAFWSAVAEYLGVRFHDHALRALGSADMPDAQWFPGATLNYAEHALTHDPSNDDSVAIVFIREDGLERTVSFAELRDLVGRARAGLIRLGIGRGDRVVAYMPNAVETVVVFLAAASLGAIWSSCSPDFGIRAVRDRFAQIEPTVLLTVDGYVYGGKRFDVRATVDALRTNLPSLRATVFVPYLDRDAELPGSLRWADFVAEPGSVTFEPVPFDHPLWVLYSSGTTGLPKGIVHGHGGIVLEHLRSLRLQMDLGPGQRLFWFTTTGWMMWNFLISGLLVGSTIVLFDGSLSYPDMGTLWRLAEKHRVAYLGVSASFIQASLKAGLRPRDSFDLSVLRAIGSTGSPLSVEGFQWIRDAVGEHLQICSISGGTDLCTAFLCAAPTVPVWLGEISCAALGAAATAYDEKGVEVVDEVGELVLTRPMPSMPVSFWNDPDGTRLHEAYFDYFPGVWRHGDWVRHTPRGSYVIYGRSDSTLNRGGVRMGTADFYAVVEGFQEVQDSLVIDTTELGAVDEGALLCFVVLTAGVSLEAIEPRLREALRSELSPRHVPDRFYVIDAVPRTLSGKKCEVPIKKILLGTDPEQAISRDSLQNPDSLAPFIEMAQA